MKLMDNMSEMVRGKLQNFLQITPAPDYSVTLTEVNSRAIENIKHRVWYDGKPEQLSQLYRQISSDRTRFWCAKSTVGQEIRKIHTGLPALIIDKLVQIVTTDFNGIEIKNKNTATYQDKWDKISKENKFPKLLEKTLKDLSVVGDGAFKISYDSSLSKLPIIEWYSSEQVEFVEKRGRIIEIQFNTYITENKKQYRFTEYYGFGYIKYKLYNSSDKEIPLHSIKYTSRIQGVGIQFDDSYMWAVPVKLGESSFKGRGKGLIEGKEDAFESFDEAWSQWMDALRMGRTKQYIPECLVPRNSKGKSMKPNPFDVRYIETGNDNKENGNGNKIYTETPRIQHESYLSSYITALDLCLQGLISPSTLGIDVKKLDNAEAQREKEKTTLYTRQMLVDVLNDVIPELVSAVLNACNQLELKAVISDISVEVKFGEYANPSFESQVETVGKARQSGVMSIEQSVEELYGDSKSLAWKEQEVQRVKAEKGIVPLGEKSEGDDL